MKWVNAIGLLLQFIAFWLAAPELLFQVTDKVANIAMVHESEFKSQPSQRKSSHMRLVQ